jgi:hypothetical protein
MGPSLAARRRDGTAGSIARLFFPTLRSKIWRRRGSERPAKKRMAKRGETDEQKARRIAAKYGVSW